jgi:hypothetical protein
MTSFSLISAKTYELLVSGNSALLASLLMIVLLFPCSHVLLAFPQLLLSLLLLAFLMLLTFLLLLAFLLLFRQHCHF